MGVNTVSAVTMAGDETSRWEDVEEAGGTAMVAFFNF